MKAVEYKKYGSPEVFEYHEVSKPIPTSNEVLIRVYASTVTAADMMMRKGTPIIGRLYLGLTKPNRRILGFEFAGEVVEIGKEVTRFKIGDKVFGGTISLGCYAEYVVVKENDVITTMPDNITFEEAAPASGSAVTVLNFLQGKGNIKKENKVLIYGASGALGTYAVQYAKHIGAEVTAVCSASNHVMVKNLGADFVIDYTKEDFATNGKKYDILFDTVGKISYNKCKNSLAEGGIFLSSVIDFSLFLQVIWTSIFGNKKAKTSSTGMLPVQKKLNYLLEIRNLMKMEKIKTVIDRQFPLSQMAAAHKYVELGHKKGNVVVKV